MSRSLSAIRKVSWSVAALLLAAAPAIGGPATELAELQALYSAREYFALRDRLAKMRAPESEPPQLGYLRAALEQVFNRPEISNRIIDSLLSGETLGESEVLGLRRLQLANFLRLHRYGEALDAARAVLQRTRSTSDAALRAEAQAKLPLLEALRDVPPQTRAIRAPSRLALGPTRRIPLSIDGETFRFALDTGANYSVIARTEATRLGLEIRAVGLAVATATAKRVLADVAVAGRVQIGNVHYRHVVFLVFPDDLLVFADGDRIPGLVGFPLVEAMGEARFRRDGVLEIPSRPPTRTLGNLALAGHDPLIRVRYGKDDLICRLDTGAPRTVFYEPFFQRYRRRVERSGQPFTAAASGVGGIQEIPAYRIPKIVLTVAAAGITLRRPEVYTRPIRGPEDNYLLCNLGLDVLHQSRAYIVSFRDMALLLE